MITPPCVIEPRSEKTGLRGFRPGPTQTGLYSHRRWLEACYFGFSKNRDCTIYVAKTKALISFVVTAKLICVFVFAYAKIRFSHDAAQFIPPCNPLFYSTSSPKGKGHSHESHYESMEIFRR